MRTSPPADCEGLAGAIAEARGGDAACVLCGAGSSDLIYRGLGHWLTPASQALVLDPMYGEYNHLLQNVVRCRIKELALARRENYRFDPARLAADLREPCDWLVMVNPNSPTGQHVRRDLLEGALAALPPSLRVWVDETYVEYAGPGQSLEAFAARSRNVVVCKSMSKVYALSGIRVAYLCGPPALIAELRERTPPWAVSLPGQLAAVKALQDPGYYARCYEQTHRLREALARELAESCGLDVVPGVANFLLCHLPDAVPDAPSIVRACRARGLFIRDVSNMGRALGTRAVRIAVKDAATNGRMVQILGDVVGAEAASKAVPGHAVVLAK